MDRPRLIVAVTAGLGLLVAAAGHRGLLWLLRSRSIGVMLAVVVVVDRRRDPGAAWSPSPCKMIIEGRAAGTSCSAWWPWAAWSGWASRRCSARRVVAASRRLVAAVHEASPYGVRAARRPARPSSSTIAKHAGQARAPTPGHDASAPWRRAAASSSPGSATTCAPRWPGMRAMAEALEDGVVDRPARRQPLPRADPPGGGPAVGHGRRPVRAVPDPRGRAAAVPAAGSGSADLVADSAGRGRAAGQGQGRAADGRGRRRAVPVEADAGELGRALRNLVINAIRHTPADGTVVRAGRRWSRAWPACRSPTAAAASRHEDLPRVFDVAFRGEAARTPTRGRRGPGSAWRSRGASSRRTTG